MPSGLQVKLSTPAGVVYEGEATGVELTTAESVIQIDRPRHGYLCLKGATELIFKADSQWLGFRLCNASAGLAGKILTILAERAEPMDKPRQRPSPRTKPAA